jgi:hypothetical protein
VIRLMVTRPGPLRLVARGALTPIQAVQMETSMETSVCKRAAAERQRYPH